MQLGGIGSEHTSQTHRVTSCMRGHTHSHQGAAAAGQTAQAQEQLQQLQREKTIWDRLQNLTQKGQALIGRLWGGTKNEAGSVDGTDGQLSSYARADGQSDSCAQELAKPCVRTDGQLNSYVGAQERVNPYFRVQEQADPVRMTPLQRVRTKIKSAAGQLAGHLPGRLFGEQTRSSLDKKYKDGQEDLRKHSRYKRDEEEIDCILTDESYLMDSYDRNGAYRQLTTKE